ncbi:ubiquinol-cytochrome C chaperone family protein [Stappia sp. ES.058]|uniref:ubiquinol-cytochrome C chaperone family protein n=1 Tax=Stappia sp. ES.058 TaxID=1881061 RepID=UPI00087D1C2A|nr:ubiquinol-cytochrome C chaperone family protein [Stappia sp. ES.058]SDU06340.1 cytochrome b pre-mRNA-processing protein 3 [Stappia sp. ES.058]
MIFGLFRRRTPSQVIATYTAIVAQARQPHFYASLDVPDTFDGRFELVMLHTILILERLRGGSEAESAFSQDLFDVFFQDMDGTLREMGVGDVTVPKKVKKMAEAFYGRAAVYSQALKDEGTHSLAEAVDRNLFADGAQPQAAVAMARYIRSAADALEAQPANGILDGRPNWPAATDFSK